MRIAALLVVGLTACTPSPTEPKPPPEPTPVIEPTTPPAPAPDELVVEPTEPATADTASSPEPTTTYDVPKITLGKVTVGNPYKPLVNRVIRRNIHRVQKCYQERLDEVPTLSGKVQSRFRIEPDGSVSTSSATGVDAELNQCIARVLRSLRFPKPTGGSAVTVRYPFIFLPTP